MSYSQSIIENPYYYNLPQINEHHVLNKFRSQMKKSESAKFLKFKKGLVQFPAKSNRSFHKISKSLSRDSSLDTLQTNGENNGKQSEFNQPAPLISRNISIQDSS